MTQTATALPGASTLKLFTVMSPWHPRDPDQGTFEENVWAETAEEAERELAGRMADSSDGCAEDEDRDTWIKEHLEACQHLMVTIEALDSVKSAVRELLAGPAGNFDEAAKADMDAILAILRKRMAA